MTTRTNTKGQARKSLSDQIDRLDMMLDGLSEGLNDAVAQAVKDAVGAAVKEAVQAVLREVLTSPELLARLSAASAAGPDVSASTPAAPQAPSLAWKARWAAACQALMLPLAAARLECGRRLEGARRRLTLAWERVRPLGRFKYQLATALGVGAAAGVAAYFAGPWLAGAAGAVGGFAAAAAVQAGLALKRLIARAAGPAA